MPLGLQFFFIFDLLISFNYTNTFINEIYIKMNDPFKRQECLSCDNFAVIVYIIMFHQKQTNHKVLFWINFKYLN